MAEMSTKTNRIYQVVEIIQQYIDGFDGDHEWEEEVSLGYYSTFEKAQAKLQHLTELHWNYEYQCCNRDFKINEIELDVD